MIHGNRDTDHARFDLNVQGKRFQLILDVRGSADRILEVIDHARDRVLEFHRQVEDTSDRLNEG